MLNEKIADSGSSITLLNPYSGDTIQLSVRPDSLLNFNLKGRKYTQNLVFIGSNDINYYAMFDSTGELLRGHHLSELGVHNYGPMIDVSPKNIRIAEGDSVMLRIRCVDRVLPGFRAKVYISTEYSGIPNRLADIWNDTLTHEASRLDSYTLSYWLYGKGKGSHEAKVYFANFDKNNCETFPFAMRKIEFMVE